MADDLDGYRAEIDNLDHQILDLLHKRMIVSRKIFVYKKERGIARKTPLREEEIHRRNAELAARLGLEESFVRKLFEFIIESGIEADNRHKE